MSYVEGPAPAGPSRVRRPLAAAVAALVLLAGCAVGGGNRGGDEDGTGLADEDAAPAQPLVGPDGDTSTAGPGDGATATTTAAGTRPADGATATPSGPGSGAGSGSGSGGGTTSTTAGDGTRPFRIVTELADGTGDAGLQARPYGDLVGLRMEDDGTLARVTVSMGGDLPTTPAEGEVIGIGVDLYRGDGESETEYQLFALGNADGWRAWLQEGDESVPYPGSFAVGGHRLQFTVPWSSLGGRRPGTLSVFADWSQARVAVVADESSDIAPDGGSRHPFSF